MVLVGPRIRVQLGTNLLMLSVSLSIVLTRAYTLSNGLDAGHKQTSLIFRRTP